MMLLRILFLSLWVITASKGEDIATIDKLKQARLENLAAAFKDLAFFEVLGDCCGFERARYEEPNDVIAAIAKASTGSEDLSLSVKKSDHAKVAKLFDELVIQAKQKGAAKGDNRTLGQLQSAKDALLAIKPLDNLTYYTGEITLRGGEQHRLVAAVDPTNKEVVVLTVGDCQ